MKISSHKFDVIFMDPPYYKEMFGERYDARYPLGLYVDVPDNNDIYQRWLVVDFGYSYELQFDSWAILPCDYRFQWIFNGEKNQMWGVTRSQNSYNSGIWLDLQVKVHFGSDIKVKPLFCWKTLRAYLTTA